MEGDEAGAVPLARSRAAPSAECRDFFRDHYRALLVLAVFAGATTKQQAQDAVAAAMEEVFRRWDRIRYPRTYARKAVVHHIIKDKASTQRLERRIREKGLGTPEASPDSGLTVWEDRQWVDQILDTLPPAQRDVMTFIIEGFKPTEIASLLGKTPEAVRKNLQLAVKRLRQHGDIAGRRTPKRPKEGLG